MGGANGTAGFSIFEYMYRDAGDFKTRGRLLLQGEDADAEATIRDCLEWGNQFAAEQVGVSSLCREHWEAAGEGLSELDHAYHAFAGISAPTADDAALPSVVRSKRSSSACRRLGVSGTCGVVEVRSVVRAASASRHAVPHEPGP